MTHSNWKSAPMFPAGDDLPLFSRTPQPAHAEAFTPPDTVANVYLMPLTRPDMCQRYQAYSSDTDNPTARRLYIQKYHAEPSRLIRTSGAVLLGPIPTTKG